MKKVVLIVASLLVVIDGLSQGCLPSRNLTGFGQFIRPSVDPLTEPTQWLINVDQRYFNADHLYNTDTLADAEPFKDRNIKSYVVNIGITRFLQNGWSFTVDLPLLVGSRKSWRPEHHNTDTTKHTTHSFGIGDLRITLYKWLFDVSTHQRWNLQAGLGIKLPTGDYHAQDFFYRTDTTLALAPVNNAIQPGDGGTGITMEINSFYNIARSVSVYFNAFYLFNPRDQNGVSNMFGGPSQVPGFPQIPAYVVERSTANVNSVPDNYTLRLGANYKYHNFLFWLGTRVEGIPVHDVLGESNGQRRAGKTISADPGLNYRFKRCIIYAFVPVSLYRQTKRTVPDQRIIDDTGVIIPSPGNFPGYQIFMGAVFML